MNLSNVHQPPRDSVRSQARKTGRYRVAADGFCEPSPLNHSLGVKGDNQLTSTPRYAAINASSPSLPLMEFPCSMPMMKFLPSLLARSWMALNTFL